MRAILMAAGMGTRLRPLTENTPKSLIKVNGMSLLERQIINLREVLNSTKTHLNVNHHQWKSFSSIGNLKTAAINEKTDFIAKSH